jgi:hypothetical protein
VIRRHRDSSPAASRPPAEARDKEVLLILDMKDALDKMVRENDTGQPFIDLATKVEAEYLTFQSKLPDPNAANEVFKQTIHGRTDSASAIIH